MWMIDSVITKSLWNAGQGLNQLINLKTLELYSNEIIEIEGLNKLTKLIRLELYGNKIAKDLLAKIESLLGDNFAQKAVTYCQQRD